MGLAQDIQTKVAEAVAANEAEDYSLAVKKMRSAVMLMAGHPRIVFEETETEFVRDDLVKFLQDLEKLAAQERNKRIGSGGFTGVPIRTRIE